MTPKRFLIPVDAVTGTTALLSGELHRHMVKVLRLRQGTEVLLADGHGREFRGFIQRIGKADLTVSLEEAPPRDPSRTAGPRITLYQGLPKGNKIDLVLEKCTELGAAAIIPFTAGRTIGRLAEEQRDHRVGRWQRIAREAARQSMRPDVPEVSFGGDLDAVLRAATQSLKIMLWEKEQSRGFKEILAGLNSTPDSVALLIGPEGGFSANEAQRAEAAGFIPVTVGRRIVRTETAGLLAVTILQFCWGDLG